jgi:putative lipoic acid-binding regulatory protein
MSDTPRRGDSVPPLSFPCPIDIKAMGPHGAPFEARVREIVARHVPAADIHAVTTRPSSAGRYLAVTVSITATGYPQLDAIYRDLTSCEDVLFAL